MAAVDEVEDMESAKTQTVPVSRYFVEEGDDPYKNIQWATSDVTLGDFSQEGVVHPPEWSQKAVGIAAKLYFATVDGEKEHSIRSMVERVARKITVEGIKHGYFSKTPHSRDQLPAYWPDDATAFYDELSYLLLTQRMAFNTPTWLNLGVPGRKQCASACYLLRVDDTMLGERFGGAGDHSIMDYIGTEAAIFKMGAGSGANLSNLRGDMEALSTGGSASGPTSYMRAADANAGTLKSGGAHRRAAKMVILDADHPNIFEFIDCKPEEDLRMRALLDAGFEINPFTPSGERVIAESTSFQNANLSVGASHDFMRRALGDKDGSWDLTARVTGNVVRTVSAPDLLDQIVDGAWRCGDPGIVFLETANEWHTTPMLNGKAAPITTCNPCAETWLNDDSACNLGSLNIRKFQSEDGELLVHDFLHAVDITTLAMDIMCCFTEGPTKQIDQNTRDLRQLGVGYANLGAALMAAGVAYDSPEGRDFAGGVTALLTGRAYRMSAVIAEALGPYKHFYENREAHLGVIGKHRAALTRLEGPLAAPAADVWTDAYRLGLTNGYRNSQATVIAPTGTISHLMDCDTTGCEPGFALVMIKGLAGGGSVRIVNGTVTAGLEALGYASDHVHQLVTTLANEGVEAFMSGVAEQHRSVFHCANDIAPDGHIDMVCAIQPFISGAPSKTVNLAESATREDILRCYERAWRGGSKCISLFRDKSKITAALSHETISTPTADIIAEEPVSAPLRTKLADERPAWTHKFQVGSHDGYVTVGEYEGGKPGELFLTGVGKEGTFLNGMMSSFAIAISIALQYGVPLEVYAQKFIGMEFEPKGPTVNPNIPNAKSFPDYIFQWLVGKYGDVELQERFGVLTPEVKALLTARLDAAESTTPLVSTNSVAASTNSYDTAPMGTMMCGCGGIMVKSGPCWTCQTDPSHTTGCG